MAEPSRKSPEPRKYVRLILAIVVASAAVCGLAVWWATVGKQPIALPNPNAYEEFVKAGHLVSGQIPDVDTATLEQLQSFVKSNRQALDLVHKAFNHECLVPVENSSTYLSTELPRIGFVRNAARLLRAEGAIAEREERYGDAAQLYFDLVCMGHQMDRGGLLIHALAGIAYQSVGMDRLTGLVNQLSPDQAAALMHELRDIEAGREPMADVIARERAWSRAANGWYINFIAGKTLQKMAQPSFLQARQAEARIHTETQKLIDQLSAPRR